CEMELLWLHIKFALIVTVAAFLAWLAYRVLRCGRIRSCDEDEIEANAHTPGLFEEKRDAGTDL
ncbi:MAG TPA: hypothetical protein VIY48_07865, partial [Candidatus Paceibacterota bacterium]